MHSRRLLPVLLLGLTSLAWMIVLPPPSSEAQAPKRGGTLRVSYGNAEFEVHWDNVWLDK